MAVRRKKSVEVQPENTESPVESVVENTESPVEEVSNVVQQEVVESPVQQISAPIESTVEVETDAKEISVYLENTNGKIGISFDKKEASKYEVKLKSTDSFESVLSFLMSINWKMVERPEDVTKYLRTVLASHYKNVTLVIVNGL